MGAILWLIVGFLGLNVGLSIADRRRAWRAERRDDRTWSDQDHIP